jgi:hypothetical protein
MKHEVWKIGVTVARKHDLTGQGNGVTRRRNTSIKLGEQRVMTLAGYVAHRLKANIIFHPKTHTIESTMGKPQIRSDGKISEESTIGYVTLRPGEIVIFTLKDEYRANRHTHIREVAIGLPDESVLPLKEERPKSPAPEHLSVIGH